MEVSILNRQNKLEYINLSSINSIYIVNTKGDANKVAFAYINEKNMLLTLSGCFPNAEVYATLINEFFKDSKFLNINNEFFVNINHIKRVKKIACENNKKFKLEIIFNNNLKNELMCTNNEKYNKIYLKLYEKSLLNEKCRN